MTRNRMSMTEKERSREIRLSIRRILMAEWDPIGVNDIPEAADEYDRYIGGVYALLRANASEDDLVAYLREIEVERMEMTDDNGVPLLDANKRKAAARAVFRQLADYFETPSN